MGILKKIAIVLFLLAAFILVLLLALDFSYPPKETNFGITFSPKYARYLKLDWQKTYIQILDDLKIKRLRIPTYWDILESEQGKTDFSWIDFMVNEAEKRQAKIILVLGLRQPRWPECHMPGWAKKLSPAQRQPETIRVIKEVTSRYKDRSSVVAWQIENEPFLPFGENCDKADKDFLSKELSVVREISSKPVIMTDSGELGSWVSPMQMSDIFGTTLYRKVYDGTLGYLTYPALPLFYRFKSDLARRVFAPDNQKTIVVELQAEPWLADGKMISANEQSKIFSQEDFKNYLSFGLKTGFEEIYLWGAEWWYFMAENGRPEYINLAKTLFK